MIYTQYYNYANGVQISVVDGKVQVVYQGSALGYQQPRLWRFSPKTGAVKEIPIPLPPGLAPRGPATTTPEATAKVFSDVAGQPGVRCYRMGDMAELHESGLLLQKSSLLLHMEATLVLLSFFLLFVSFCFLPWAMISCMIKALFQNSNLFLSARKQTTG